MANRNYFAWVWTRLIELERGLELCMDMVAHPDDYDLAHPRDIPGEEPGMLQHVRLHVEEYYQLECIVNRPRLTYVPE
jgi:hypothetical protein